MKLEYSPVRLDDVDRFSEWEIGLGWDIESTQLSGGHTELSFDHIMLPGLLIGNYRCRRSMLNTFSVPEDVVILVITRKHRPIVWNGRQIEPSTMGICRAPHGHWAVVPDDWDCYEFMISEELIRRTDLLPESFLSKTQQIEKAYLPLIERETSEFVRRLDRLFQMLNRIERIRGSVGFSAGVGFSVERGFAAECYDAVLDGLHRVFDAGLVAADNPIPRLTRRPDLVSQAKEVITSTGDGELTAADIAATLGVSYRTLNYAIREALGISPYQLCLTERLHAARRRIRNKDASVLAASLSVGFKTPSRFARQYLRLFGELPSETRRKSMPL